MLQFAQAHYAMHAHLRLSPHYGNKHKNNRKSYGWKCQKIHKQEPKDNNQCGASLHIFTETYLLDRDVGMCLIGHHPQAVRVKPIALSPGIKPELE